MGSLFGAPPLPLALPREHLAHLALLLLASAENTPVARPEKDDALVKVRYGIIGAGAVSDFHREPIFVVALLLVALLLPACEVGRELL